jgi:hypothetical protein
MRYEVRTVVTIKATVSLDIPAYSLVVTTFLAGPTTSIFTAQENAARSSDTLTDFRQAT